MMEYLNLDSVNIGASQTSESLITSAAGWGFFEVNSL